VGEGCERVFGGWKGSRCGLNFLLTEEVRKGILRKSQRALPAIIPEIEQAILGTHG